MKDPGYLSARAWHQDLNGHDLAQDTQWDAVAGSDFHPDPSLDEWPRPHRSYLKRSPVRREDFVPTSHGRLAAVPGPTDCQADLHPGAPATSSGRRATSFS